MNRLIVFEGINGAGKSSLVKVLSALYPNKALLKFPTQAIREKLLNSEEVTKQEVIEQFSNSKSTIEKYLKTDDVFSDRYVLSSMVYQSVAITRQLDYYKEDTLVLIDCSAEIAIERIKERRREINCYENVASLTKCRAKYLELINEESLHWNNVIILDGSLSKEELLEDCINNLNL